MWSGFDSAQTQSFNSSFLAWIGDLIIALKQRHL